MGEITPCRRIVGMLMDDGFLRGDAVGGLADPAAQQDALPTGAMVHLRVSAAIHVHGHLVAGGGFL